MNNGGMPKCVRCVDGETYSIVIEGGIESGFLYHFSFFDEEQLETITDIISFREEDHICGDCFVAVEGERREIEDTHLNLSGL